MKNFVKKLDVKMNKALVLVVYSDDETLGCGGTLLKHKANGDEIHWLILQRLKSLKVKLGSNKGLLPILCK